MGAAKISFPGELAKGVTFASVAANGPYQAPRAPQPPPRAALRPSFPAAAAAAASPAPLQRWWRHTPRGHSLFACSLASPRAACPRNPRPSTPSLDRPSPSTRLQAWDAVPQAGKLQILSIILALEWATEAKKPHYMRGGVPGKIEQLPFDGIQGLWAPKIKFWDPLNFTGARRAERGGREARRCI